MHEFVDIYALWTTSPVLVMLIVGDRVVRIDEHVFTSFIDLSRTHAVAIARPDAHDSRGLIFISELGHLHFFKTET
jgi:hypothetical protein